MRKVASKGSVRKCVCEMCKRDRRVERRLQSTARAVGGDSPRGTPGERASGSPHGSSGRHWVSADGVAYDSHLSLDHTVLEGWCVRRVDVSCGLGLAIRTTLVFCDSLLDASQELAAWSHSLSLPFRDYLAPIHETQDPVAGWPL